MSNLLASLQSSAGTLEAYGRVLETAQNNVSNASTAGYAKQLATLRKEVLGLRFSNATGELDDTAALAHARRDLARVLTVARERELAGAPRGQ